MTTDSDELAAALICSPEASELLRAEGATHAGAHEGLLAHPVLDRIVAQARALGLPPDDIGLEGFDPDSLPTKAKRTA